MGFLDKVSRLFNSRNDDDDYIDDDYIDDEYEDADDVSHGNGLTKRFSTVGLFKPKVVEGGSGSMEVTMIKPVNVNDSNSITDSLLDGKAVLINLEGISSDTAQRILDFTSGSIYAIGGDLQMVSRYIFIASPSNIDLTGPFQAAAGLAAGGDRKTPSGSGQSGQSSYNGFSFNV